MTTVNIRELTRHFSSYLKAVKVGQRITVMERNVPVAELIPHNENIVRPGWKRKIKKLKLTGEPLAKTILKNRRDESH